MLADYFTKPLQGILFQQLRDMIMGRTVIALPSDNTSPSTSIVSGIPEMITPQESRSVLENENVSDLTVCTKPILQSCIRLNKTGSNTVLLPCGTRSKVPSKTVLSTNSLSWADVVARRRQE